MELKRGRATARRGDERLPGSLVLDGRLLRFDVDLEYGNRRPELIEVVDIKRLERRWSKVLGFLPLVPNGLTIVMRNGEAFAYALPDRKAWIAEIEQSQADTPKG